MLLTGHSIDYEKDEVVERPWNCVDGGDDIENEENEQSCFHCIVFHIRASVHMAGLFAVLYDSIILTQIIPEIKKNGCPQHVGGYVCFPKTEYPL